MARNEVSLRFRGDDTELVRSFGNVGTEAKDMADDIDRAAKDAAGSINRLETDANGGFSKLNEGVEGSVGKFRGFKDTIDGTTDIAEGFATGDVSMILGGFADLADGVSSVILPKLGELAGTLRTKVVDAAGEMAEGFRTAAANSAGFLGEIIGQPGKAGFGLLFVIELARGAKQAIEDIASGKGIIESITKPSGVQTVGPAGKNRNYLEEFTDLFGNLFGHTGGMVPGPAGRNVAMVLQAGEQIIPRGQTGGGGGLVVNVAGSVITERDLGRIIADQLRNNRLIGVN
jgi:hypothetical protein